MDTETHPKEFTFTIRRKRLQELVATEINRLAKMPEMPPGLPKVTPADVEFGGSGPRAWARVKAPVE